MPELYTDRRTDLVVAQEALGISRVGSGRIPPLRRVAVRLISDNPAGLSDFETYLGAQADMLTTFAESNNASGTWQNSLTAITASIAAIAPLNRIPYFAWPGMMGAAGNGYEETMRGDHDPTILQMLNLYATHMRTNFPNEQVWLNRLPWEFNFWNAFPWGRERLTPAQYKRMVAHLCKLAWSVDSKFAWDWCPNARVTGADQKLIDPTPWDPGPEFAEIVSIDAYLNYGDEVTLKGKTPDQAITEMWEGDYGIMWMYHYAEKTNRPFGISETATLGDGTASNVATGDLLSAHWKRLYEFVRTRNVVFHGLWNKDNMRLSQGLYPKASQAYKDAFGKVTKPWTPALHFGNDLVEHLDVSDASTLVLSGSNVNSLRDKVANKTYSRFGAAGAVYSATARNGLPGITFDATGAMVLTDITSLPAVGKAQTIAMQVFTADDAAEFSMYVADSDANGGITNSRAIGFRSGNLRAQGVDAFVSGLMKNIDAGVVLAQREAYAPTVDLKVTVQGSINGGKAWSDEAKIQLPAVTPTKRVLMGAGAASNGVGNNMKAVLQEMFTIKRPITRSERDLIHGYLAWKWGRQADLPDGHPYKLAAPTYG